ncbi:hypothetical protein AJR21_000480 [Shigella dysenteriae]|nr:hypothetical protein AJR21_000480 [Shigella dysenteriae]
MHLLIGSRLQIFYWTNFWYLPIDMWSIDWLSPKTIHQWIILGESQLIIKTATIPLNTKKQIPLNQDLLFQF